MRDHSRHKEEGKGVGVAGHSQSSSEKSVPYLVRGCEMKTENSEVWAKLCGAYGSWYHVDLPWAFTGSLKPMNCVLDSW